jgi:hypothetical protein
MIKLKVTTKLNQPMPAWYYGKAYENYDRNTVVWAIVGLHTIIKIGRYAKQAWNIYRGRKTWFDKQWILAYEEGIRKGWFARIEQENHSKYLTEELRLKLKLNNEGIKNAKFN